MSELNLRQQFELGVGAYDLSGAVDLALQRGAVVEWGDDSGAKGYGIVVEIDAPNQQANVVPLEKNADGKLTRAGERRIMKDLDLLSPSDKQLAPDVLKGWPNTTRKTAPADASADLTSADLWSLEQQWKSLLGEGFHRWPREETAGSTDLSDDDLFRFQKRLSTMSNAEFAEARREPEARHADLSADPAEGLSDDELYQWGQDVLSGTAAKWRAERGAVEAAAERAEDWSRAYHERGEPLPRDLQEEIGG